MSALNVYTEILGEFFGDDWPAATVVEVKALALEPLLVEIEAITAL